MVGRGNNDPLRSHPSLTLISNAGFILHSEQTGHNIENDLHTNHLWIQRTGENTVETHQPREYELNVSEGLAIFQ